MEKRIHHRGLAGRLSTGIAVAILLLMTLIGILTVRMVRTSMDHLVEVNVENTLDLVGALIESEFTGTVRNYLRGRAVSDRALMRFHHQRSQAGEISPAEARQRVSAILLDPDYGQVGTTGYLAAVSTSGILEIHPLSPGVDASGHAFMQQAMAMREGYLEYEWQNPGESSPRVKAGYLAYFEPWDLMVWASSYKAEFATLLDQEEILRRIGALTVGEGGYVLVSTADGGAVPVDATPVDATPGDVRIDSFQEPALGWTVAVVTPMESYRRTLRILRLSIAGAIAVAALLVNVLVRILVQRNLKPLGAISTVVEQVTSGDLSGTIKVYSNDEMQDIADLFNRIIQEFSAVLRRMGSVIAVLGDSVQNLSASTQEIASTSNEQAAAVKEVLSTMEDADRLSRGVETRIQEVARIAGNTRESVQEGFGLIQTSLTKMEEIRNTNGETITGIKTLGDRIESIWEIVNIINGIADQTKIIAFNAELEAAAAGEAGKNFQIVAGEIRRLADGTVDSTNEIRVKINEIQHASDKLIIASEQGTQRIREGWEVSTNIRGVFENVLSSSEITATSAGEISRSTRMQVASFEQIFLTLKQISESIDSFVESTAYTTEVSDHLREIADSFREQVSAFRLGEEE